MAKADVKKIIRAAIEIKTGGRENAHLLIVGSGPPAAELGAALLRGAEVTAGVSALIDVYGPAAVPGSVERWAAALVLVQPELDVRPVREVVARLRDAKVPVAGVVSAARPGEGAGPRDVPGWTRRAGLRSNEIVRDRPGGASLSELAAKNLATQAGDALLGVAAVLPVVREAVVRRVITAAARQNGVVGALIFIPGADMPVMTMNQVRMVLRIAAAYGEELGAQRALEILSVVGAGFGLRAVAREALDAVPVAGWALKGTLGYTATLGLGRAAKSYFEAGAPLAPEKAKGISEKIDSFIQGSLGRRIVSSG